MAWNQWSDQLLYRKQAPCSSICYILDLANNVWSCSQLDNAGNITHPDSRPFELNDFNDMIKILTGAKPPTDGVKLGGQKYFVLRAVDDYIIFKLGESGGTIAKGAQCVIVALYKDSTVSPGNNTAQVLDIRDSLVRSGY